MSERYLSPGVPSEVRQLLANATIEAVRSGLMTIYVECLEEKGNEQPCSREELLAEWGGQQPSAFFYEDYCKSVANNASNALQALKAETYIAAYASPTTYADTYFLSLCKINLNNEETLPGSNLILCNWKSDGSFQRHIVHPANFSEEDYQFAANLYKQQRTLNWRPIINYGYEPIGRYEWANIPD